MLKVTSATFDRVMSMTLDHYCADRAIKVALMKIDVEGMEVDVVLGASHIIQRDKPYIICESWSIAEFSDLRTKLVTLLEQLNYYLLLRDDDIIALPKNDSISAIITLCNQFGFNESVS
jgi:hypothetical protein